MTANKQQLIYTISDGIYNGYFKNFPQVSHVGDTLENLTENCTRSLLLWLEYSKECLDSGIESKEVDLDTFLNVIVPNVIEP